ALGRVEGRDVIVSGSTDRTVRVWDAATGNAAAPGCIETTAAVAAVATSELQLIIGAELGIICLRLRQPPRSWRRV
ncbi:MAG: hypothetical protein JXA67_12280, partial [Micromonosporaceae bacterium]|nr:hypothetical protein [Micromonosporaceae bacterium]